MSFLANGTDLSRDGECEVTVGTAEVEMTLSFWGPGKLALQRNKALAEK